MFLTAGGSPQPVTLGGVVVIDDSAGRLLERIVTPQTDLTQEKMMAAKKKVFISFDYDNDKDYRYLLSALKDNAGSDIDFSDLTPEEIQSEDVGQIKGVLTTRINQSTHTLVIVGKHANTKHPNSTEIGTRNWQWWEIEKTKEKSAPKFIAVKIEKENESPDPLLGQGATWAQAFKVESILNAIDDA